MTGKSLAEVKVKMMQRDEFRAAYEADERKERLQALLEEWRNHAGLTSAQVAEKMGIKPPTVSRMEKNITSATYDTLARYARACGISDAKLSF